MIGSTTIVVVAQVPYTTVTYGLPDLYSKSEWGGRCQTRAGPFTETNLSVSIREPATAASELVATYVAELQTLAEYFHSNFEE